MAATATATKKPHSVSPQQPSNIQQIPSKSHSNTPCKAFIIVVLLLLIPLFPSRAPDFITQTHFTQFWEIIHLLFIGIAVSYGLFATRTPHSAPENPPSNHQEEEFDRIFAMPKPNPTLPEYHEEKQHVEPQNATKPEKEREDESDKNSDEEDAKTNIENDSELEGSEVDRKAGEFIAKFREQIRLQKTSSIEGYSGW